jgi:hypothetical protein
MKTLKVSGLIAVLTLTLASPAYAAEFILAHEKNDQNVSVPASETHKNLYAAGANVDINGKILGDLFAAGGVVTINSSVEKDLNAAGGNLNINATVGNVARIAGGNISINSPIASDLLVAGGNVTISQKASVGGDLIAAGGNLNLDSEVKGRTDIHGGVVTINGKIDGDLTVTAGKSLIFGSNSVVTGKITYTGPNAAVVRDGAKVGTIQFTKSEGRNAGHAFKAFFVLATLFKLLALLVAGFVFYYLLPGKISSVVERARTSPWGSLGVGFLTAVVTPILFVILMITLIGFYLGLILLFMYLLMLILASVLSLFYTGNLVYSWYRKSGPTDLRRDLVLGAIIMMLITLVPFLGWLALAIVYLIALGALVTYFRREQFVR